MIDEDLRVMCILVSILLDIEYDHENEGGDDRCDGGKMRRV